MSQDRQVKTAGFVRGVKVETKRGLLGRRKKYVVKKTITGRLKVTKKENPLKRFTRIISIATPKIKPAKEAKAAETAEKVTAGKLGEQIEEAVKFREKAEETAERAGIEELSTKIVDRKLSAEEEAYLKTIPKEARRELEMTTDTIKAQDIVEKIIFRARLTEEEAMLMKQSREIQSAVSYYGPIAELAQKVALKGTASLNKQELAEYNRIMSTYGKGEYSDYEFFRRIETLAKEEMTPYK